MSNLVQNVQDLADEIAILQQRNNDLTQELERAKEGQHLEELFRLFSASVQDFAILMLDPDGHVITWNTGAERIKGYTTDEILHQHFSVFYPQEDIKRAKPANALEEARTTGRYEDEGWRVRKDGTRFWANVIISAMRDETGELRGFAKITRDITARKQMEEMHQQSIRQDEVITIQQEALRALSTPLIPITDKIVVMPLIGNIDSVRTQAIMETLLTGISQTQATLAVLDITGVPLIDTFIAKTILQIAQASRLIGTRLILTGIRPETAQTLVSLGADMRGISTHSTLQRGISYALRQ